jgi:hypothetical protein
MVSEKYDNSIRNNEGQMHQLLSKGLDVQGESHFIANEFIDLATVGRVLAFEWSGTPVIMKGAMSS